MTQTLLPVPSRGLWEEASLSFDTMSPHSIVNGPTNTSPTVAGAWPTANLAIYVPIRVQWQVVLRKLWLAPTTTATTGNLDVGLYTSGGTRIISAGNTNKAAGTAEQIIDVTDTVIYPGLYFMALVCSNNTDTFSKGTAVTAPFFAAMGCLSEALGSAVLGTTASWSVDQTNAFYPIMGFSTGTVN